MESNGFTKEMGWSLENEIYTALYNSELGDLRSVLWQSCDQFGFPDLAASHFDFEK